MNWTPVVITVALWAAASASLCIFALWEGRRAEVPRWLRWDSTEAEVAEWGDVLRAVEDEPEPDWEAIEEGFARYVDGFADWVTRNAARRRALKTPTAEYRIYVRREFGVALGDVGPREITCRVIDGLPTLMEVAS